VAAGSEAARRVLGAGLLATGSADVDDAVEKAAHVVCWSLGGVGGALLGGAAVVTSPVSVPLLAVATLWRRKAARQQCTTET
jgi:hypothetical protein